MTPDGKSIAGFYTLSQFSILSNEIPEEIRRRLTKHGQLPATLIGRLARHRAHRGTDAGDSLLADALQRCLAIGTQAASWAAVVEAKDERGTAFYRRFGFEAFPSHPLRLFLPTVTIEKLFASTTSSVLSDAWCTFSRNAHEGRCVRSRASLLTIYESVVRAL